MGLRHGCEGHREPLLEVQAPGAPFIFTQGLTERDEAEVDDVVARVANHLRIPVTAAREAYRHHREHGLGAIIGSVRMVGCATSYASEWWDEDTEYGFILSDPEVFDEPIPCKGFQKIFKYKPS